MTYNSRNTFSQITDGSSNTIIVSEVRGYRPESPNAIETSVDGRGMRWEISTGTDLPINALHGFGCGNCRWENPASFHSGGGIQVLMGDGSVQWVRVNIDATTFQKLWAIQDGSSVTVD
jgi:prepilin-type processing-associated H-X9-DG protein